MFTAVKYSEPGFTAVYLTAVHLGSEDLTAVNMTQLKLTAFNLTATDTNLQARRAFNFLAMNESINYLHGQFVEMLSHLKIRNYIVGLNNNN